MKKKYYHLKGGEIIPADLVLDERVKDGVIHVKYKKYLILDDKEREMTCYDIVAKTTKEENEK